METFDTSNTVLTALPKVEIYSDIHCPWAYLANYRLRQLWPEYEGRLEIVWRSLSLEYINRRGTPKRILDLEMGFMKNIQPDLPIKPWSRPDWQWPVTMWPAFEALNCAQAQGSRPAFEFSWELRRSFFEDSHSPSLRSEIYRLAREVGPACGLDVERFEADWDSGRYKQAVIEDSLRGWHDLKVKSSPTFVLPGGQQFSNPSAGDLQLELKTNSVKAYTPAEEDWPDFYRAFLDSVGRGQ
jgi:predicted DsbA family dithiol-disulfide isomerase